MEKRNLHKSVNSLMTTGAVVTVGINHPIFTTVTTLLLGVTRRERRKHASCHITPFNGNAVVSQSCRQISILNAPLNFFAPICNRKPATVVPQRESFDFKNLLGYNISKSWILPLTACARSFCGDPMQCNRYAAVRRQRGGRRLCFLLFQHIAQLSPLSILPRQGRT